MADLELSERNRRIAVERWQTASPEQRSRNTEAARQARKTAAQRIAALEARFDSELSALRAKVIDLEQRVAA